MGSRPWAVGIVTSSEAMVSDPRPSWAVPLSWEVTAKALGGRPEALIRWGMPTDANSNARICRLPRSLTTNKLAVWEEAVLYRTSPLSQTFRELGAERNGRKFGHEKYRKSLENIADNAGGQDAVARVAPPAHLTKIQQKRTCLQIPAQSQIFKSPQAAEGGLGSGRAATRLPFEWLPSH